MGFCFVERITFVVDFCLQLSLKTVKYYIRAIISKIIQSQYTISLNNLLPPICLDKICLFIAYKKNTLKYNH